MVDSSTESAAFSKCSCSWNKQNCLSLSLYWFSYSSLGKTENYWLSIASGFNYSFMDHTYINLLGICAKAVRFYPTLHHWDNVWRHPNDRRGSIWRRLYWNKKISRRLLNINRNDDLRISKHWGVVIYLKTSGYNSGKNGRYLLQYKTGFNIIFWFILKNLHSCQVFSVGRGVGYKYTISYNDGIFNVTCQNYKIIIIRFI